MKYILDTNIIIDYIRNFRQTVDFVNNLISIPQNNIYLPTVVNLELHLGKSIEEETIKKEIELLLSKFIYIGIDLEVAGLAGDLIRNYQISTIDAIIAAISIDNNLTLITKNRKHFTKIKDLHILTP